MYIAKILSIHFIVCVYIYVCVCVRVHAHAYNPTCVLYACDHRFDTVEPVKSSTELRADSVMLLCFASFPYLMSLIAVCSIAKVHKPHPWLYHKSGWLQMF